MARKRRKLKPAANWPWHEEMLAELEQHGSVMVEGQFGPQRITYRKWHQWKQQTMAALDNEPERLRHLVHEHGPGKGREMYAQELLARPRCPHGRQADICATCNWAKHQEEQRGRSGETLSRRHTGGALDRARRRGLDV